MSSYQLLNKGTPFNSVVHPLSSNEMSVNDLINQFEQLKRRLRPNISNRETKRSLKDHFTSHGHERTLKDFQKDSIPGVEHMQLALPLLNGLGIASNYALIEILNSSIQDCIEGLKKIAKCDVSRLIKIQPSLLEYLAVPYLQRIPLELLNILPFPRDLSPYYVILEDNEAMGVCPIEVKRALWSNNPTKFKETIKPIIDIYVQDSNMIEISQMMDPQLINEKSKSRYTHKAIKDLVYIIGDQPKLYDLVNAELKVFYYTSGNILFCNLRFDLTLAFCPIQRKTFISPESEPVEDFNIIFNYDVLSTLVRHLDAAISMVAITDSYQSEIKNALGFSVSKIKDSGVAQDSCDIAMIFRASFVMNWTSRTYFKCVWNNDLSFSDIKVFSIFIVNGLCSRYKLKIAESRAFYDAPDENLNPIITRLHDLKNESITFQTFSESTKEFHLKNLNEKNPSPSLKDINTLIWPNGFNAILFAQLLFDRFKSQDHYSVQAGIPCFIKMFRDLGLEEDAYKKTWDCPDHLPQLHELVAKPDKDASFFLKLGVTDVFWPLVYSIIRSYYSKDVFGELCQNTSFFFMVMNKLLLPLAETHYFTHVELLKLIIFMYNQFPEPIDKSYESWEDTISITRDLVESLAAELFFGATATLFFDSKKLFKYYSSILNSQKKIRIIHRMTVTTNPYTHKYLASMDPKLSRRFLP